MNGKANNIEFSVDLMPKSAPYDVLPMTSTSPHASGTATPLRHHRCPPYPALEFDESLSALSRVSEDHAVETPDEAIDRVTETGELDEGSVFTEGEDQSVLAEYCMAELTGGQDDKLRIDISRCSGYLRSFVRRVLILPLAHFFDQTFSRSTHCAHPPKSLMTPFSPLRAFSVNCMVSFCDTPRPSSQLHSCCLPPSPLNLLCNRPHRPSEIRLCPITIASLLFSSEVPSPTLSCLRH